MATKNNLLGQLSIPSPCATDWKDLVGDGRRRYCEHCRKNVYDFSKMTATEVTALLATLQGRVCARITWQADGTILTEEPLPVLPVVRRRASPFASVAVTTLITITASPAGPPPARAASIVQTSPDAGAPILGELPHPADAAASIAGTVSDKLKAVITGARVSLINQASGETVVVTSSDTGEFHFSGVSEGAFTVRVESPGFATVEIQDVKLAAGQEQRVDATMDVEWTSSGGAIGSVPTPLRVLYSESELIVVARIGESKIVEKEREARRLKTTLHVSAILKGKTKRATVDLFHWSYGDEKGPFVAGQEMLLFLKAIEGEPGRKPRVGFEVADTPYGIRKVEGRDLRAYLDRIEELSQLSRENGPVDAAVVEWLVRCAEDPATRWEGASELVTSFDRHASRKDDEDTKVEVTDATPAESAGKEEEPDDATKTDAEPDFSALLTAEQRTRLMTALFQTEEMNYRDLELAALVQKWKDARLAPFLVEQLHRLEARPPRLAEGLMNLLATAVDDKTIKQLAEDYQSNVSYPDEDREEESGEALTQLARAARDDEAASAIQTRREGLAQFLQAVEAALAEKKPK